MQVVHLIFSFNVGGSESMLVDILNSQAKYSNVYLIIINNKVNPALISLINKRDNVFLLNREEGSLNILPIVRLNLLLFKLNPSILHCHNHNIIPLLLPVFRSRSILTLHSLDIPIKHLHKYKKVFAISKAVANDIESRSNLKVKTIYNGINVNAIHFRNKIPRVDSCLKVVCVGRLIHTIKGQDLILKAFSMINNDCSVILDFIGGGLSEQFLRDLSQDYDLKIKVNFLGERPRDYIYQNLQNYDLLIQPSISEGFGLTIVEAMVAGVLTLVSDLPGPMEIIDNGKYGYFFKCGDSVDLSKMLQFIILNYSSSQVEEKQLNARKFALSQFDIEKTAKGYFDNYLLISSR